MYAFLHSQAIYEEARQRLFRSIACFKQGLVRPELFRSCWHFPVFSTSQHALCAYLQEQRVLISSFRYPTPANEPVTRIVLISLHSPEDLHRLLDLVNSCAPV
ncbi:PLP-dependent aminotransferase family protein [Pontibacter russatus]|uniref:hypothetical protein n=1 Tax=Pontibacter russatus TaxID=2694929 RepID=UPI00137B396E|nr:hypothetical protein [Pontibacter russatus]